MIRRAPGQTVGQTAGATLGPAPPAGAAAPPDASPPKDGSRPARPWWGLVAALLAGAVATLVAPAGWSAGPGTIEVHERGALVLTVDVEVGSADAVQARATGTDRGFALALPDGVPVDEAVTARLQVTTADGTVVRPDLDGVAIDLVLPDGRHEPVPVLRWEPAGDAGAGGGGALVATRHPPVHADVALGLLAVAVVLWVTGVVPLFATAVTIPVVLVVGGVATPTDALAPFFHPIIALFLAGFLLAEAMRRVELDTWAAGRVMGAAGRSPRSVFLTLLVTAAFLSMWMSNTAAVAVLIPIALAVAAPVGHTGFTKVLVLGTAYAATLGGVGSAIGTPANMLAIEYLDTFDVRAITFAGWFVYGLPLVVVFLPVIAVYLWWRFGVEVEPASFAAVRVAARAQSAATSFGRPQARVLAVFGLVAAVWLTETWHGIHPGIVALGGVVVLALTRDLREDDLGRINWSALLTFGAGLSLGLALTATGVADWVATRLGGLGSLPDLAAVGIVAGVTLLLTTVASNTASAATLIPLAIPLASLLGVDVTLLVVVVAIASSIDFALIIGTPPTMLAYSTGLFRPAEILRIGAFLDLAGLAFLLTAVTWVWHVLGVA